MSTNPNKALWEKGDFTQLAQAMRGSGDTLVESLGVTSGMKVVRAIGKLGDPASGSAGTPLQSVVIEKATVREH